MGSGTRPAHKVLVALRRVLERRAGIAGIGLAWITCTFAIAIALSPAPVTVLMLLVMGMIVVGMLQSRRQHLMVVRELRRHAEATAQAQARSAAKAETASQKMSQDLAEVLDRLKLTALSLGRLSEDLAQSAESVRQLVTSEAGSTYGRLAAIQNLYALASTGGRVPPIPGPTASPESVVALVEALQVERPSLVVECGSGVSTLWCASAIRWFGIDARIVSLEHDSSAADETRRLLAAHGVTDVADVRHAPLEPTSVDGNRVPWYAHAAWADLEQIGILVINGRRPAAEGGTCLPALRILGERLADTSLVLVQEGGDQGTAELEDWLTGAQANVNECTDQARPLILRRKTSVAAASGIPGQFGPGRP